MNFKRDQKLLINPNVDWKSVQDNPPEDGQIVLVGYVEYYGPIWAESKTTVAKYDSYYETFSDCLNMLNTIDNPLFWTEMPELFEKYKEAETKDEQDI